MLDSAGKGPVSLAMVVAVGYPMLDLALVATVAGIAALPEVRVGGRWFLLILGLLVYPLMYGVGRLYIRLAEQGERDFMRIVDAGEEP